jgi:hypothetical protein
VKKLLKVIDNRLLTVWFLLVISVLYVILQGYMIAISGGCLIGVGFGFVKPRTLTK